MSIYTIKSIDMKQVNQVNPIPKQNVAFFAMKISTWIYLLLCAASMKAAPEDWPSADRTMSCAEAEKALEMPLACKGSVQLSLGADGTALVTPAMLLAEPQASYARFKAFANRTGTNRITCADAGRTIQATVVDTITGQSCWSSVVVEDKLMPVIRCFNDTVSCTFDPFTFNYSRFATATDNCDGSPTLRYDLRYEKLNCHPRYTSIVHLTWTAVDDYNNVSTCMSDIYFKKASLDSVKFPNDTIVYCPNPNLSGLNKPTIFGMPIDPLCEILATHTDDSIFICGGMYKINRLWVVMDWCRRTNVSRTQQITVADTTSPVITCPPNVTLATSAVSCSVDYLIPSPSATDACSPSNLINYFVRVDSTFLARPGNTITLSLGRHTMNYIAIDPCGNSDTCFATVTIVDRIAPTLLCLPRLIVSLDPNGVGCIAANQLLRLNNISDNCGVDSIFIRRMTPSCGRPRDTIFRDTICFCCSDIMTTQMIVLKAQDKSGNMNFCMMEIVVQNKQPIPTPTCPPNITIRCTQDFKNLNITGRYIPSGVGCSDTLRTLIRDSVVIDSCKQGIVKRKFIITYLDGRIDSSCSQTITIVNNYVWNPSQIRWPRDTNISNCRSNHPDSIRSKPSLPQDTCQSVYFTFTNSSIKVRSDSCRFIERYWLAYTTCIPRMSARDTQIIVLDNFLPPRIKAPNDTIIGSRPDSCARFVILLPATVSGCNSGVVITNNFNNGGANATGIYPPGTTNVIFTATDGCNNTRRDTTTVIILDQINPTIQCKLLDTIMPSTDSIKLTARNLLVNYTDNCTPSHKLKISFTQGNFNDTCRFIHCRDLPSPPDTFKFSVFVQDSAGNIGICMATVIVRDPMNNCGTIFQGVGIYGFMKRLDGTAIQDVDIHLSSHSRTMKSEITGEYVFPQLDFGTWVRVTPIKDDDWLYGVSTNDILRIQKHILGIQSFTKVEEWISADVDKNGHVTAADISTLRKLLLGKISRITTNTSWRFINQYQSFDDLNAPLDTKLNDSYDNDKLNHDLRLDYAGIKIGDVTNSGANIAKSNAQSRVRYHDLLFENINIEKNNKAYQDVIIKKATDIEGLQLAFEYDINALELESITEYISNESGKEIKSEMYTDDQGKLIVSLAFTKTHHINNGDKVMRIKWKAKTTSSISNHLYLESAKSKNELYAGDGTSDQLNLAIQKTSIDIVAPFDKLKVMPVPFKYKCYIQFNALITGEAELVILDIHGKEILRQKQVAEQGENVLWIESQQLPGAGTYIYKLSMNNHAEEGKIIMVK